MLRATYPFMRGSEAVLGLKMAIWDFAFFFFTLEGPRNKVLKKNVKKGDFGLLEGSSKYPQNDVKKHNGTGFLLLGVSI